MTNWRRSPGGVGTLLREIVETIDTYGLKTRHLGKHRKSAAGFIERVVAMKCATEAGLALKKRIEKNRNKLFTFLDYDGVPWNNNNAEHALRAFTRLRNIMTTSTPKGHREYATLLSIQQTLRYRGMGFLEFLRLGRMEIDGWSGRKNRSDPTQPVCWSPHATGAEHRLHRDITGRFGPARYAIDEVIVELTGGFVMADNAHEPRAEHAAYIASWLKVMKNDPRAIFTAASKAQAAADWMHAKQPGANAAPS
jgi:Zincin-like metallopeptidase/Transposase IS66 family